MTDKEKIKAEIERRMKAMKENFATDDVSKAKHAYTLRMIDHQELLAFINSLPEEHVSPCVECASISEGCKEICYDYNKWVRDNHKEKTVSKDLEEAATEICSKILKGETVVIDGYEYVVLSDAEECFKAGSQWQKANLWKPADGDDLPEIDREVVVLIQDYPNDKDHLRVAFAHRPNKYAKVWNSDLGEEQVIEIDRYDKGGWNIPNIVLWLDVELPKEIE